MDNKHHLKLCLVVSCCLFLLNVAEAKTIFKIPSDSPYLNISSSHRMDTTALGPTDFVVFNHLVGVLDSDGNKISFFDLAGKFIKKINLPDGYYQRLMRDKDNKLYAFANDGLKTTVLKISNEQIQKITISGSIDNVVSHAVIDDAGIFFQKNNLENSSLLTQLQNNPKKSSSILKKLNSEHFTTGYRINRDCFSCSRNEVNAPYVNGLSYQLKYKNAKGDDPILMIGNKEIKLNHKRQNAGTRIEQIDSDGTVWIEQSIINNDQKADTYVLKILASGDVDAIYLLPNIHPDDYVDHQIAISDKGELWFMRGQPKELLFDRIEPMSKSKNSIFFNSNRRDAKKKINLLKKNNLYNISVENNGLCQVRALIFIRGLQYLYFSYCYPSSAVENDASCPSRKIPPYLLSDQSQCLFSVSYNWGGFDSVDLYNEKLQRMKAGNVNTAISPLLNCTTGVDCSGFVSNLWGLNVKWGTAQIFNNTFSIDINMMQVGDVFVKPNYHVMLYTGNSNAEITTMESVARPGKVIVSQHPIRWFLQHGYTPKMAFNACPEE